MEPDAPAGNDRAQRVVARFRGALGAATFVMLALSWPLWTAADETFPRVPFVRGAAWPDEPTATAWLVYAALLVAVAAGALLKLRWAWALAASVFLLVALVVQDQHRFQPWVYQYLVLALVLLSLAPTRALHYARWWFAGVYFYSGLSKLDVSFLREMGASFLVVLVRPFGLNPALWSDRTRAAAALAMPVAEIVVAALLLVPRTRRLGLIGALLLHAALVAILGPWGLGHSTIVLVWNVAMMLEAWVLFGPGITANGEPAAAACHPKPALAVKVLFWAALVAPLGERWGWLDAWPAHALYASHVERTAVYLFADACDAYPEAVRRHLARAEDGPWRRLDLTGWSRAVRGTPVYPAGRACNGLAEALAARYGGPHPVRVLHWSQADRWTGRRALVECLGVDAIRRQAERYWWNARPAHGRDERTE